MRKEIYSKQLVKFLNASVGDHAKIAKKVGISQATISRIYLGKCSPSLEIAETLLSWFWAQERLKMRALTPRYPRKAVTAQRRGRVAASASISQ